MLRTDHKSFETTEEDRKNRAFNELRTDFSKEMLKRFHEVKENIEDIWDLLSNETALSSRLKTLALREVWTENNLKDMALLCCVLWNNSDEE